MAVGLNQAIRGRVTLYRLIYFMPVVTTIVAGAIVFRLLLATNGPVNNLLGRSTGCSAFPSARRTGWAAATFPSGRW
jgi:ABC-type sugar transport system permease subunit